MAFPTDTVYGLGCDPGNSVAVHRLWSVKGRRKKPFPILVSSKRIADEITIMNAVGRVLVSKFWPGPLTLVLRSRLGSQLTPKMYGKTIAARCPKNEIALKLIRRCGGLLIGTSANRAGKPPCTTARMVRRLLGEDIDAVVDGGRSPTRISSTIVEVHPRGVTVLRKGPIRESQIQQALVDSFS